MVLSMLDKAFRKRKILTVLFFIRTRDCNTSIRKYQKALEKRNIIQSMSRKGNCLDNAMMENFFGLLKNELLYVQEWNSVEEFKNHLIRYIKYYNYERIKLRLKGKSLVQYRAQFLKG